MLTAMKLAVKCVNMLSLKYLQTIKKYQSITKRDVEAAIIVFPKDENSLR